MASDLYGRNEDQGLPFSAGSFEKESRNETPSVKRSTREGFTFIIGAVSSDLDNPFRLPSGSHAGLGIPESGSSNFPCKRLRSYMAETMIKVCFSLSVPSKKNSGNKWKNYIV
jgi:hypothetical protein